jgi:hypothetical protein
MEAFLTNNGRQLSKDLLNVQRAAKAKGARMLTKPLTAVLRGQVERVIELFERSVERYAGVPATRGAKAVVTLQVEQHGELWAQAINDAFRILGKDVQATIQPVMQSVADDVLDKTTTLLTGDKPSVISKRVMQQNVNEIATQVTRINKTTQTSLARLISKAIDDGKSPGEVMEEVRRKIPQIATNRVPTIVRTEMGRVSDRAMIRSMKDSAVVTHVSVSGCEAIEQGIPTFRGTPTCNIKNVPIEYAGDLQFHINHTGAITASGFRQENGSTPALPLKGGEGIGTWEDRGRPVPAFVSDGGPPKPPKPPQSPPPPAAPITPTPLPPTPPLSPAAPMVPVKPKPLPKPKPVVAPKPTPAPVPIPAVVDPVPAIAPAPVSAPIIPGAPATPPATVGRTPVGYDGFVDSMESVPSGAPRNTAEFYGRLFNGSVQLTNDDRLAFADYIETPGFSQRLRTGFTNNIQVVNDAPRVRDLTKALSSRTLQKETYVFRGLNAVSELESLKVGDYFVEDSFMSTTPTMKSAFIQETVKYGGVVMRIKLPKGAPVKYVSGASPSSYYADELETLLQRGTKLRLVGKTQDKGVSYLDFDFESASPDSYDWVSKLRGAVVPDSLGYSYPKEQLDNLVAAYFNDLAVRGGQSFDELSAQLKAMSVNKWDRADVVSYLRKSGWSPYMTNAQVRGLGKPDPVPAPIIPDAPSIPIEPIKQTAKTTRLPGIPADEKYDKLNDFLSGAFTTKQVDQLLSTVDGFNIDLKPFENALTGETFSFVDGGSVHMQRARFASDEKPTLLNKKEFAKAAKDAHPLGHFDRGVDHPDPLGALQKDKAWQGSGVYGDGYYHQLVAPYKRTLDDTLDGKFSSTAIDYAEQGPDAKIMVGFLRKEANVISNIKVDEEKIAFTNYIGDVFPRNPTLYAKEKYGLSSISEVTPEMLDEIKDEFGRLNKLRTIALDLSFNSGAYARVAGYDAIHVESMDYLVVVNNRNYVLLDETAKWNDTEKTFFFDDFFNEQ